MHTVQDLITKAEEGGVLASNSAGALLSPQKAKRFMDEVFDDSSFLGKITHTQRTSVSGSIEQIGIAKGLLRRKHENVMPNLSNPFSFPMVPYTCKAVSSPLPVSEDFFRQNIEGQSAEDRFLSMMKEQVQLDTLNVLFNGDEAIDTSNPLYDTLSTDDGVLKQLKGSNYEFNTASFYPKFSNEIFNFALRKLPTRYFKPDKYRWITSYNTYLNWIDWLSQKQTTAGDMAILSGNLLTPHGISWEFIPDFPEDVLLLADPKNFAIVNTYNMILRKTTEGMNAVLRDMRYYTLHFDMDTIIFRKDACVLLNNVPSTMPAPPENASVVNVVAPDSQPVAPEPAPACVEPAAASVAPAVKSRSTRAKAVIPAEDITENAEVNEAESKEE